MWVGLSKETAHQLGTPISSLIAWVEYLRTKDIDPSDNLPDNSYTVSEDDPYAALAQAAADAAAAAGDTTTEPTE